MSPSSNDAKETLELFFLATTQAYEQARTLFLQLTALYQGTLQKEATDTSNSSSHDVAPAKSIHSEHLFDLIQTIQQKTDLVYERAKLVFEEIASTSMNHSPLTTPTPATPTNIEFATLFSSSITAYLKLRTALLSLAYEYLDASLLQDTSRENWAEKARDIANLFLATGDNELFPLTTEFYLCLYETYYRPAVYAINAKKWEKAQKDLEALIELKPDYKDARQLCCDVYYRLSEKSIHANNMEQADTYLARLRNLDPSCQYITTLSQRYPLFLYHLWKTNNPSSGFSLFQPHPDDAATCLATSPNGQLLAIGFSSGKICIYTTTNNELLSTLNGHKGQVLSIAFAGNNEILASGDEIGHILLWNARTGARRRRTPTSPNHPIEKVTFLSDFLAFQFVDTKRDPYLHLWNRQHFSTETFEATCIAFEPTKQLLALGFPDGTIKIGERREIGEKMRFSPFSREHGARIIDLAFSPDKLYLYSIADNDTIKLWNLWSKKGKDVRVLKTFDGSTVAFSSDGRFFASADQHGSILLWDALSREQLKTFSLPDPLPAEHIVKMVFSSDQQSWIFFSEERIFITRLSQILSAESTDTLPVVWTRRYEGGKIKRDSIVLSSHSFPLFFCDEKGTVASLLPKLISHNS